MSAGKGDTPRAVNGEVFRRNYDSIFAENLEQARLLAMSADREEKLRDALGRIARLDTSQDASPAQCSAVAVAMEALQ